MGWIKQNAGVLALILISINIVIALILSELQKRRALRQNQDLKIHLTTLTLFDKKNDQTVELHKRGLITKEEAFERIEKLSELVKQSTFGDDDNK